MNYLRLLVRVRRNPSAILLPPTQLLALVLYPFFEDTEAGRIGLGIFGIFVLIMTMRMIRQTPSVNWIGMGIAFPAIALLLLQMLHPVPQLAAWSAGLESLFYFYAAGSLIAYMLADRACDDRRAVRGRGDIHPSRVGFRLPVPDDAGTAAGLLCRRAATWVTENLDGAHALELRAAVEHWNG